MGKSDFQISYGFSVAVYIALIVNIMIHTYDEGFLESDFVLGLASLVCLIATLVAMAKRKYTYVDKPNAYDKLAVSLNFLFSLALALNIWGGDERQGYDEGITKTRIREWFSALFLLINIISAGILFGKSDIVNK